MTWIIKATGGECEYACDRNAEVFGADLSDAYRFHDEKRAKRIRDRLNRIMLEGLPYRIVRVRSVSERLRAETIEACAKVCERLMWKETAGRHRSDENRALRLAAKEIRAPVSKK